MTLRRGLAASVSADLPVRVRAAPAEERACPGAEVSLDEAVLLLRRITRLLTRVSVLTGSDAVVLPEAGDAARLVRVAGRRLLDRWVLVEDVRFSFSSRSLVDMQFLQVSETSSRARWQMRQHHKQWTGEDHDNHRNLCWC